MSERAEPTDLRLLPAALACWVATGLALDRPAVPVLLAAGLVAVGAAVVLPAGAMSARWRVFPRRQARAVAASVTLTLVAAAVALASAGTQLYVRGQGSLDDLVRQRAVVEVVGMVTAEVVPQSTAWGVRTGGAPGTASRFRTVLAVEQVTGRGGTSQVAAALAVVGGPPWRDVAYGSRVAVTGRLAVVEGQEAVGTLTATAVVVRDPPGATDRVVAALRRGLLVASDHLPVDARGLVPGMVLGDTSRVPPDLALAMRDAGLLHLTAVSGGHFAIVLLAVVGLATAVRAPRGVRAVTAGLATGALVLLVHPQPSVVRAAVMGAIGVLGMLLGRRSRAVPALAAAVVVLLIVDPWLARSIGFALSVGATGAIVLLAPAWARAWGRVLPRWIAVALAVPAAAQTACAPLVVLIDPAVPVYAVPANLLVAPAVAPATLLGLAAALTAGWAPGVAELLAKAAGAATWWISAVARVGADLPGARLDWPGGPRGSLALVAAAVLAVATWRTVTRSRPGIQE